MGPEDRAMLFNTMLKPDPYFPNLKKGYHNSKGPGPQIYFLAEGEGVLKTLGIWEEFYWERFRGGDLKGEPKDKVPDHKDDELDAACYIACPKYRWTSKQPKPKIVEPEDSEDHEKFEAALKLQNGYKKETEDFATIAKPTNREVVMFGSALHPNSSPSEIEDEKLDGIDFTRFD